MAITGIDTIEGKQIIAAGAVSAKSAEMAYNDENGNPITGYQVAGNYYSASNPSGFITGVPVGTMNESALSYDASNNITAYNGSAFKAGDEFPQSATEAIETVTANSADWNGTTETVSSNSGAWGGSALPVSAGPGIKISLQNDTLVFENDETLLYSTSAPADTISLSEASTGFEKLRLELSSYQSREIVNYTEVKPNASYLTYFANTLIPAATYPLQIAGIQFTANNAKDYTMTTGVRMCYKVNATYGDQYTAIATTNIRDVGFITKIWGINRIAGV